MTNKREIIGGIIELEGGYVNDPSDSGGETKYGITKKVACASGHSGFIKDLTEESAYRIYSASYWMPLGLYDVESIYPGVAPRLMDMGVHMGVPRTAEFLQQCLNLLNNCSMHYQDIEVDGFIGKRTIKALREFSDIRRKEGGEVLEAMLASQHVNFLIELALKREKDERFVYGWIKKRILKKHTRSNHWIDRPLKRGGS